MAALGNSYVCLRLRSTFIEVGTDTDVALAHRRSNSEPPEGCRAKSFSLEEQKRSYVYSLTEKAGQTPLGLSKRSETQRNIKSATCNTVQVMSQMQDSAISQYQKIIQAKKPNCSTENFPYLTTQSVDVLPGLQKQSNGSVSLASIQHQSSVPMECFLLDMKMTVDSLPNILEHCKCEEKGIPNIVHMQDMIHMPNMTLDSLPGFASSTLDSLPNFNDGFMFEALTVTSDSLPVVSDRSILDERARSMTVESLPTVFESDDPVKRSHATLESLPKVSEKTNMGLLSLGTLGERPKAQEAGWEHPLMKAHVATADSLLDFDTVASKGIPGLALFREQSKHHMQDTNCSSGMRPRTLQQMRPNTDNKTLTLDSTFMPFKRLQQMQPP